MDEATPIISLRAVSRMFRSQHGEVLALSAMTVDIFEGEFVTVVGPSGCGKSTALNIIVGLLEPTAGEYFFRGQTSGGINKEIGYVTQADNLFPWRAVVDNVSFGLEMRGIGDRKERRRRSIDLLDQVGLAGFHNHYRHELSGGMRQRVNLIRTLVYDPKVILVDEPFGPLDAQNRLQLQDLLLRLWHQREGTTIVFITHDLTEANALADRVVMTARPGKIREVVKVDLPRPRDIYMINEEPSQLTNLHLFFWRLLVAILILVAWEGISGPVIDPFWLSRPSAYLWEVISSGQLWDDLFRTFQATVIGYAFGAATGSFSGCCWRKARASPRWSNLLSWPFTVSPALPSRLSLFSGLGLPSSRRL